MGLCHRQVNVRFQVQRTRVICLQTGGYRVDRGLGSFENNADKYPAGYVEHVRSLMWLSEFIVTDTVVPPQSDLSEAEKRGHEKWQDRPGCYADGLTTYSGKQLQLSVDGLKQDEILKEKE